LHASRRYYAGVLDEFSIFIVNIETRKIIGPR